MNVDSCDADARHLKRRIEDPQCRREHVADAGGVAAADAVHLVNSERQPKASRSRHVTRETVRQPGRRRRRQYPGDRRISWRARGGEAFEQRICMKAHQSEPRPSCQELIERRHLRRDADRRPCERQRRQPPGDAREVGREVGEVVTERASCDRVPVPGVPRKRPIELRLVAELERQYPRAADRHPPASRLRRPPPRRCRPRG